MTPPDGLFLRPPDPDAEDERRAAWDDELDLAASSRSAPTCWQATPRPARLTPTSATARSATCMAPPAAGRRTSHERLAHAAGRVA